MSLDEQQKDAQARLFKKICDKRHIDPLALAKLPIGVLASHVRAEIGDKPFNPDDLMIAAKAYARSEKSKGEKA